ncbi:MAG: hypothetical protein JNK48_17995 [Bryobacterales bacterium]|nr:hypothetical protein [Bryobacterales bacterium]
MTIDTVPMNPPPDADHDHDHESCEVEDCQVCMRLTIPQHVDCHGTKLEDEAGIGEYESLGG